MRFTYRYVYGFVVSLGLFLFGFPWLPRADVENGDTFVFRRARKGQRDCVPGLGAQSVPATMTIRLNQAVRFIVARRFHHQIAENELSFSEHPKFPESDG